jgi:hypothetical protein
MEEIRVEHKILAGNPVGKRSLGRPRRRWYNIKLELGEVRLWEQEVVLVLAMFNSGVPPP